MMSASNTNLGTDVRMLPDLKRVTNGEFRIPGMGTRDGLQQNLHFHHTLKIKARATVTSNIGTRLSVLESRKFQDSESATLVTTACSP